MKSKLPFSLSLLIFVFFLNACYKEPIDYSKDINDLKALVTALQQRSDSLANALGNTNTNLSNLSKSVDSIKLKLTDIQIQIDALTLSLTTANANIAAISAELVLLNQQYAYLLDQLNAILARLNAAPPTITDGLIAYYPFTGNAGDSSGNGNHGTVNGAILITDRFENTNNAYSFDGTSSFIQLPLLHALDNIGKASFCFWVKNISANGGAIIGHWGTTNGGVGVNSGFVVASLDGSIITDNYSGCCGPTSNTIIDLQNWNYVVVLFDGSKINTDRVKFYINGLESTKDTGIANSSIGIASNSFIGKRDIDFGNFGAYFGGYLDEIRIYNRVLSQSEITYLSTH